MALYMMNRAEDKGLLKRGGMIIEVTSGNTGIAFAMLSAARGYRFTAVMPSSMSMERIRLMKAFGARVVLTPAKDEMGGAMKKYREIAGKNPNAWLPRQFENEDNITAHRKGLGKEIIKQMNGDIGAFVAGMGTGGTLLGVAQALKRSGIKARIIGVEPAESAVLSGKKSGKHGIQGIGEGFIPKLIQDNIELIDEIMVVKSNDAMKMSRLLSRKHGVLVGISSGANMLAAMRASKKYKNVVTVLPDRGERYLSSGMFDR